MSYELSLHQGTSEDSVGPGSTENITWGEFNSDVNWHVSVPITALVAPANMLITHILVQPNCCVPYDGVITYPPASAGNLRVELFNATTGDVIVFDASSHNASTVDISGSPYVLYDFPPRIPVAVNDVLYGRIVNTTSYSLLVNNPNWSFTIDGDPRTSTCTGTPRGFLVINADGEGEGFPQPTLSTVAHYGGGELYDVATLSDTSGGTGTITFTLWDGSSCSGTPVFTSTVPISDDGTYESDHYHTLTPGHYYWTVRYSGDEATLPAITSCGDTDEDIVVAFYPGFSKFQASDSSQIFFTRT